MANEDYLHALDDEVSSDSLSRAFANILRNGRFKVNHAEDCPVTYEEFPRYNMSSPLCECNLSDLEVLVQLAEKTSI